MPDDADAEMPPKLVEREEVEINPLSADSVHQMPSDSQELVTPDISPAEAPGPTPEASQNGDCMGTVGVGREEDVQEALMRLGLQTILSPSNQAISTQDAELAAVLASSPLLVRRRADEDAASNPTAELQVASDPPSVLHRDAQNTAEMTLPKLAPDAHEAATDTSEQIPAASVVTDPLLMNLQRSSPADVTQDAALNEASEALAILARQDEPGRDDDVAISFSQPNKLVGEDPEEFVAQDILPQQNLSHSAGIAVMERESNEGKEKASGAILASYEMMTLPEQPVSLGASVQTETDAIFEARDIATTLPDIIPDSEEEEASVV